MNYRNKFSCYSFIIYTIALIFIFNSLPRLVCTFFARTNTDCTSGNVIANVTKFNFRKKFHEYIFEDIYVTKRRSKSLLLRALSNDKWMD